MAQAQPSDVKEVITTNLSDSDIQDSIDYAEELNDNYNTPSNQSTVETKNIERWMSIINIRQHKERSVEEDSAADSSAVYEGDELERAKNELVGWLNQAGEDLSMLNDVIRNTSRYTGSATPNS